MSEFKKDADNRMQKTVHALEGDFSCLRIGRANASLFDKVRVNYYDNPTPLNQLASISVPEARLIVIQPFDKNAISDIEKAILSSDLGLNPGNDGKLIRISIPTLNEERRNELVKQARQMTETARVSIRNIRRDVNEKVKSNDETEDDKKRNFEEIQKLTDDYIKRIDAILKKKKSEIMEV